MKIKVLLPVVAACLAADVFAAQHHEGWRSRRKDKMTFTADRLAVDNVTKAAVASGHVHAVYAPLTLRSEYLERKEDGSILLKNPTCVTTCTNEVGHTHWNVTGELEYKDKDHILLRDAVLRFCEFPIFWLPYMYYPLEKSESGFSWLPGYTGRWGVYLLTRTRYHLLGDPEHKGDTYWLRTGMPAPSQSTMPSPLYSRCSQRGG